jgi:adenine-specific DNA methylase
VIVTINLPLRTVSAANAREHWSAKARRVKRERTTTRLVCMAELRDLEGIGAARSVTFTRIAPRLLDSDNLASGLKAIRDELAAFLGVSDAPSGGVDWRYEQRRGPPRFYAVEIAVEIASDETCPAGGESDLDSVGRDATVPPRVVSAAPPEGAPVEVGCVDNDRGPRVSRNREQQAAQKDKTSGVAAPVAGGRRGHRGRA